MKADYVQSLDQGEIKKNALMAEYATPSFPYLMQGNMLRYQRVTSKFLFRYWKPGFFKGYKMVFSLSRTRKYFFLIYFVLCITKSMEAQNVGGPFR